MELAFTVMWFDASVSVEVKGPVTQPETLLECSLNGRRGDRISTTLVNVHKMGKKAKTWALA